MGFHRSVKPCDVSARQSLPLTKVGLGEELLWAAALLSIREPALVSFKLCLYVSFPMLSPPDRNPRTLENLSRKEPSLESF